ncbi:predicted protein [Coccidioides posadasii str. Silveira]|uniref:Predicted protein n=2 Tax=Coccidioides posadasii TaxID=199306 RepID=E9CT60_COCPS|nr:predicted protein [Coccidioides posadasii str. Silveira]KMM67331.1 hypothetical protein CPAG_03666 [Coccidioides posadasii RMSCC 3488]
MAHVTTYISPNTRIPRSTYILEGLHSCSEPITAAGARDRWDFDVLQTVPNLVPCFDDQVFCPTHLMLLAALACSDDKEALQCTASEAGFRPNPVLYGLADVETSMVVASTRC